MVRVTERIDEIFQSQSGVSGVVDLRGVFRLFWGTLTNGCSLVDLAGVYAISIPTSSNAESLTHDLFQDFFRAFARLKYPSGADHCERLLDEVQITLKMSKGNTSIDASHSVLLSAADKQVMRVLLKYDLPLRRAFSTFCGQAIRVGAVVTWDEVSRKSGTLGSGASPHCSTPSIL